MMMMMMMMMKFHVYEVDIACHSIHGDMPMYPVKWNPASSKNYEVMIKFIIMK
jgi:hypothetical protein